MESQARLFRPRIVHLITQIALALILVTMYVIASLVLHPSRAFAASDASPAVTGAAPRLELPWPNGIQHNINGGYTYGCGDHTGRDYYAIDFALPLDSKVSAVDKGTVHEVFGKTGYGNYIWILHANGFVSLYGHLDKFKVKDGAFVKRGQVIALSGNTGNSSGPHLHFSLRSNATNQFDGNAYKPEPMSGYVDFGNWGIHQPSCDVNNPSPEFTSSYPQGNLWMTGHDADYHCIFDSAQCNYLKVAVNFVIRGSNLPILALDHGTEVATAISLAFGPGAPSVKTVDPRSGFASLPLVGAHDNPLYSAIIVASDITCNGCDNNDDIGVTPDSDAINARALAILTFFDFGGGILALAGAENSDVFYNFLPVSATAIPTTSPYTFTHAGLSFGLIEGSDDNCCATHNSFDLPGAGSDSSLTVLETDAAGQAETLVV